MENTKNREIKFPSKESTISFDVISDNNDIDSKGNEIDSNGNQNNYIKSNFSYDIIPSEYNKSQDNIDDENELIMDNKINTNIELNSLLNASDNANITDITSDDIYQNIKEKIECYLEFYKKTKHDIKSKRKIRPLERHLHKLKNAESSGIKFFEFKNNMINTIKSDANINPDIKNLYI